MIGVPAMTLYYQRYEKEDEVAYCPDCEETELLVDDLEDWPHFGFCPDCHGTFHDQRFLWKSATKDSEYNIPKEAYQYHAVFVIQQGQGNWTNIKYRTFLQGTVDEFDKLQRLIRKLKPLSASNLIKIIETYDTSITTVKENGIMTKYECGHESEMLALDGSPTMLSAYLRWSEGVETYGDKSMCFKCWYDSSVSTITKEEL